MSARRKLAEKTEQAVAALLCFPTIEEAAKYLSVTPLTLRRWRETPHFQKVLQAARERLLEDAMDRLRSGASKAMATLDDLLRSENDSVRARATAIYLEHCSKLMDTDAKLRSMQKQIDELSQRIGDAALH